jgi:iron-sulfur cluster insertion protein
MSDSFYNIQVTPEAIEKLLHEALVANEEPVFRIAIKGGGCSGFQYDFSFSEKEEEDYVVFDKEGFKVIIDPVSINYLNGITVKYERTMFNEQIVIQNPNIKSTCGCGKSFA